jgi:hypothetical protein
MLGKILRALIVLAIIVLLGAFFYDPIASLF